MALIVESAASRPFSTSSTRLRVPGSQACRGILATEDPGSPSYISADGADGDAWVSHLRLRLKSYICAVHSLTTLSYIARTPSSAGNNHCCCGHATSQLIPVNFLRPKWVNQEEQCVRIMRGLVMKVLTVRSSCSRLQLHYDSRRCQCQRPGPQCMPCDYRSRLMLISTGVYRICHTS